MMGTKNISIGDVFLVDIGGGFKSIGLVRARSDRKEARYVCLSLNHH